MTRRPMLPAALLAIGLVLAVLGWLLRPALVPHAWLAALFTLLGWPLGSMALLLIHSLTGGRWGELVRVPLLLGVVMMPVALVAAVPVFFTLPLLYPWLHADTASHLYNTWYLNLPFFTGRVVAYAVIWLGLALLTLLGSLGRGPALSRFAPPALIVLALTATFASIDLTMSLDPTFNSSVYGELAGTGMVLFALAVAILLVAAGGQGRGRDDLGKVLLALCILWSYLDFMQLLIVWSSNLSHDAPWYARRFDGFWGWALGGMALLHSIVPILLLAIPRFRRSNLVVMTLAAALVLSGVVRSWWLVLPEAGRGPGWVDVASMLGLGAAVLGLALLAGQSGSFSREPANV